jgi:2-desacetyl-2-hydroxyethyl bacteriochlorophyllide A dehydrogenase
VRAVRLVEVGKPLLDTDVELPHLGPHDIRVDVAAAGICHSDAHYRSGAREIPATPLTPGHEIAGIVAEIGGHVSRVEIGDRVAVHYLVSCGLCPPCLEGREQFCEPGEMIGFHRDGGYAESVVIPARNAHLLPETVPFEVAAIMMCSTSTSLHALRRGRLSEGEDVAVFGCGGLGVSAIKLAWALGAGEVYGIDVNKEKLEVAEGIGAIPIPFNKAHRIRADVALELVGLPETMEAAVKCLKVGGRAVAVGITSNTFPLDSFHDLTVKEAEILGAADHLGSEIDELIGMVDDGRIDLSDVVTGTVPLDADAINEVLDRLESFSGGVRTVIGPGG